MLIYQQKTGQLFHNNYLLGIGYSGKGDSKNIPYMENIKDLGPIPIGFYSLGNVLEGSHMGPFAIELIPNEANKMHGRSGFYIHGDNATHDASEGCIIQSYAQRLACKYLGEQGEKLQVVTGL